MKIVHYINEIDRRHGGAQVLVRALHDELNADGIDSNVCSLVSIQEPFSKATSLECSSVYSLKTLLKVKRSVKNLGADVIVHAHLFPTIFYLALLKKLGLLQHKLLFTEHSTSNRRRNTWYGRLIDNIIYSSVDHIIAISQGTADELLKWQPRTNQRVTVIQNGVKMSKDRYLAAMDSGPLVVVSMGRLTEAKNYTNMIKAFTHLRDENIIYRIGGEGGMKDELQQLIDDNELSESVKLMGYQEDVSMLLGQAQIFLIASTWEGFGIAAIEAMNFGLPLVASNVPGLKEVVGENGSCALLVDPDNPGDIAKKIKQLAQTRDLRETMGRSSFDRSLIFGIKPMTEDYKAVYLRHQQ